jgi:hypothetical protein
LTKLVVAGPLGKCKVADYLRIWAAPRKLSANGSTLFANEGSQPVMSILNPRNRKWLEKCNLQKCQSALALAFGFRDCRCRPFPKPVRPFADPIRLISGATLASLCQMAGLSF